MKPSGLSGSPWLIGIWRLRPFVRMVDLLRRAAHDGQSQRQRKGQCEPHPSSRCPRPPHVSIVQTTSGSGGDAHEFHVNVGTLFVITRTGTRNPAESRSATARLISARLADIPARAPCRPRP